MNIDISKIVTDKLTQLDNDGVIQRKIEETIEKSVMDAITSELDSYNFKNIIREQLKQGISEVSGNVGLSAYNGYIAQAVKAIVSDMQSQDIAEKVKAALDDVLLKKYENVKLSDIFARYREWVKGYVDLSEQRDLEEFTAELEVRGDCPFVHYTCRFADRPIAHSDTADVSINFVSYRNRECVRIARIMLDGHDLKNTLHIGTLTEFEAFVVNLYYNGTEIVLDPEAVSNDCSFDLYED